MNQPPAPMDSESLDQPPEVCPPVQKEPPVKKALIVPPAKRMKRQEISDLIKCDIVGADCKEVPTFFRAGKSFPQWCKQHKTPDIDMSERKEKFGATKQFLLKRKRVLKMFLQQKTALPSNLYLESHPNQAQPRK